MPADQTNWVVLSRLLRPQGRKGELLAELLTDFPDRFNPGNKAFLTPSHLQGSSSQPVEMEIVSAWLPQGRNQGRIVLGFSGIDSIDKAERLAGLDVVVRRTDRLELTDGSVYIDDMIGCTVFDRDVAVGTVRDVEFMTTVDGKRRLTEAAPLLTVEVEGGEALIPFAKDFLLSLNLAEKHIYMQLPEGLIDLNTKPNSATS